MENKHVARRGIWERFRRRMVRVIGSRPSGGLGRFLYAHPWGHYAGFRLVLERLRLSVDDIYLEVAQGGGVLLSWAFRVVNKGAAIDHSPDMVKLATQRNRAAVDAGRLEIVQGDACRLPWAEDTFTAIACSEAFFFFPRPDAALREMHRVLRPGGRVVIATMSKGGLRGSRRSSSTSS